MDKDNVEDSGVESGVSPKGKWFKNLFFGAVLVLVLGVLLAFADRLAGKVYTRLPANGRAATDSLCGIDDTFRTGTYLQHPYLYYVYRPGYHDQFNSLGHRGKDVTAEPAAGVLRILCIGGSTTVSFPYAPKSEDAWPAKLGEIIEKQANVKVEVVNAGLNGANSQDILAHYMFRNRYLKPHIVVLHLGGNDAMALLFPDYNPEYTHFTKGWKNTALASRPFEPFWLRSNIVKCVYALWLQKISLEAQLGRSGIQDVPVADCLENVKKNEPVGFKRNLDLLVGTIISDGAIPVLFPFVSAPEDVFRRDLGSYCDPLMIGIKKDDLVMDEVAKKYDVQIVKLPEGSIPSKFFKDFCHVYVEGETIKAEHISRTIMPIVEKMIQQQKFVSASVPSKTSSGLVVAN